MKSVVIKSFLFAIFCAVVTYFVRFFFHTDSLLIDVSGLSAFVTVFGTLYGIMTAFVVFEVWSQYNETKRLTEKEAQGLERLFRLTLYFRDEPLNKKMKAAIKKYADIVIKGKFKNAGGGVRGTESAKVFREISEVIRDIKFDDDHDSLVFSQVLEHYGQLSLTRTERLDQALTRLPTLLKVFLYSSSFFALVTFVIMPFSNPYYNFWSVAVVGFIQAMIFQLVEDLDNPFVGHWNITPEPFERAMKHIEEDY
jgi:hypothetical protein